MSASVQPTLQSVKSEEPSIPAPRSSSIATYDLAVGDTVGGKFKVERILGEGGMGLVVAAEHLVLNERVALKFLHPSARKDPQLVGRFFQEARAAAKLKSEHVAHVLDVGARDDGLPYIVMEYLSGQDLRRLLEKTGPLSIEDAVEFIVQACEGLSEAHARGIVHRDIKPENLFMVELSPGWRIVKVLDFGISKLAIQSGITSDSNIKTGHIMGSPCYMSPEQLRETAGVDGRTDIWALGVVLYELLTGETPFDALLPLTALIVQILEREPQPARVHRADIPPELDAVIARCLAKDREARFATAAELAVALLPFAPKRARVAAERAMALADHSLERPRPALPSSLPAPHANTALALDVDLAPLSSKHIITHPEALPSRDKRKMRAAAAGVALAALATGALVWIASARRHAEPPPRVEAVAAPAPPPRPPVEALPSAVPPPPVVSAPPPVATIAPTPHPHVRSAPHAAASTHAVVDAGPAPLEIQTRR